MMIITYAEHAVRVHIYKGLAFYYTSIHIPIYPHTTCIVLYSNPTLIYTVTNPDLYMGGGGGGGGSSQT